MPHTAYNAVSVIDKLPLKIESLESWGDNRLIVGTSEGVLFIYEVNDKTDGPDRKPFFVTLVDAQKSFSRKPVTQLTVLEQHKILVSLSDGYVSVHDLPSFHLRSQIAKSKGCHLYALDKNSRGQLVLCAAIKRKLVLFNWDGNDFTETKELALPDIAKTVVWCGENICIGFKKEYNLINIATGAMTELFPTGKTLNPLATLLPNQQILLGRDNISIFIGFDGKPTRKYGLMWAETPLMVGYSFPYVLALLNRGVEVRTMSSSNQNVVQSIALRSPICMSVKEQGGIFIAAANNVWKLIPVPLLMQVDELVREREYEEALAVCENIPDSDPSKNSKIQSVKILFTYHSFCQGHYERAMQFFLELGCDPLMVVGLYPNLLPRDLRSKYTYPMEIPDLAGVVLEKALQALSTYLVQIRHDTVKEDDDDDRTTTNNNTQVNLQDDYHATTDLLTIIDTCLLKCYIKTSDMQLAALLMRHNHCHVRESEKLLQSFKKFMELVLLYRSKGLHRNALELLAKLGQQSLVKPTGGNYGPAETIQYMKMLGGKHVALIFEFSKWVLQTSSEEALAIFVEPRPPNDQLPPQQVVAHIKSLAPSLLVPYLEHIIAEQKETAPEFHNELVFHYLDTILALKKDSMYHASSRGATSFPLAGSEPGLLGSTRKKLINFLEQSQHYNPEKMLSKFPYDDLFEERAILLSRIGQHDKALQIYAHRLQNHEMAEKYCARNYDSEKEDARDVYLALMRVYLRPPEGITPMLVPALSLLNRYYTRLDVPKALELLPPDTPVQELYGVFEAVMRENSKTRRNNQVVKNLLKAENLQVREQLINVRSRVVKIDEDRMCPVCNRRLGTSVFACYPNGVIVHYICCKDINVCPVTKTVFNKDRSLLQ